MNSYYSLIDMAFEDYKNAVKEEYKSLEAGGNANLFDMKVSYETYVSLSYCKRIVENPTKYTQEAVDEALEIVNQDFTKENELLNRNEENGTYIVCGVGENNKVIIVWARKGYLEIYTDWKVENGKLIGTFYGPYSYANLCDALSEAKRCVRRMRC